MPSAVIGQIDRPLQDRKGQRDTDNIIGEYGAERDFRQNRHPHIALQQTLIGGAVVTLRDDIWSKARLQAIIFQILPPIRSDKRIRRCLLQVNGLAPDIKAGKLSCYTIGNVSMTLDSTFLLGTLTTANIPDSNMTFYSNPEYDAIVEEQSLTDDPDERLDLITQALQIEARDVPRINLFYMVSNIAYNKDLNCKVCAALESYNWSEFSWN